MKNDPRAFTGPVSAIAALLLTTLSLTSCGGSRLSLPTLPGTRSAQTVTNPPTAYAADTSGSAYRRATAGRWLRDTGPTDPSADASVLWSPEVDGELARQLSWLFEWMDADTKGLDSLVALATAYEPPRQTPPQRSGGHGPGSRFDADGLTGPSDGGYDSGKGPAGRNSDRVTSSTTTGPITTPDGVTVGSKLGRTVWLEGGMMGEENLVTLSASMTVNGATVTRTVDQRYFVEVAYCPDPAGISAGRFEWSDVTTLGGAPGALAAGFRVTATLAGHVDDNAMLTRVDMEMDPQVVNGASGSSLGRADVSWTTTTATGAAGVGRSAEPHRWTTMLVGISAGAPALSPPAGASAGQLTSLAGAASAAEGLAAGYVQAHYGKAMDMWREGACVEVVVLRGEERMTLKPSERIAIEAESEHKLEKARINAPVEAHLIGSQTLAPLGVRVPPLARFDYVAPADGTAEAANMRAHGSSVDLISISRRGIGTKYLEYGLEQFAIRVRLDHVTSMSQPGVDFRTEAVGETVVPITFNSATDFEGEADLAETTTGHSSIDAGVLKMQCQMKGSETIRIKVTGDVDSMGALDITVEGTGSGFRWDTPCQMQSDAPTDPATQALLRQLMPSDQQAAAMMPDLTTRGPAGQTGTLASGVLLAALDGTTVTVPIEGAPAGVNARITLTVVRP